MNKGLAFGILFLVTLLSIQAVSAVDVNGKWQSLQNTPEINNGDIISFTLDFNGNKPIKGDIMIFGSNGFNNRFRTFDYSGEGYEEISEGYTIENVDYKGPGTYTVFVSAEDSVSQDRMILRFVVKSEQTVEVPPVNGNGQTSPGGNGQTPVNGNDNGQVASGNNVVSANKKSGAYFYDLNKVRVYGHDNRLDAHVTLRNIGKKISNLNVDVMLVNRKTGNVIRSSEGVRLDLNEVRRETFSFGMPEKGEYLIIVEADDGKINGFTREVRKIKV